MECGRCGKKRQSEKYCSECKKARVRERNIRYQTRRRMSKTLRKKLGV